MSTRGDTTSSVEPESALATATATSDRRANRLASRVRALRTRAGAGNLDRWLLILGGTLIPLGLMLVALGWLGASRTALPFEQTPYLISGGLLGACLVFCGGFVYFAYWQTVRVRDGRRQHEQLLNVLERMEDLIAAGVAGAPATGPDNGAANRLVATAKGSLFHRVDCQVVVGRPDVRTVRRDETDLRPCQICQPVFGARINDPSKISRG